MALTGAPGQHLVTVKAVDIVGHSTTSSVAVATSGTPPVTSNAPFTNWPGNIQFTAPLVYGPRTLAELVNAIVGAEGAGHHVRAFGSSWSFSDAICATDRSPVIPALTPTWPGAMIGTVGLSANLQPGLSQILAPGVDATHLIHVEAGITISDLNSLLDQQSPRQTLNSGGGSGQSLAGVISTSTHGGDSLVPPLADYVCAMHLVGAGGIEHWIEPSPGITNTAQLRAVYPGLAPGNIHYDTLLFNAVLVSAGSMGVIYSVILKTVPQFGLVQHRAATTWEALLSSAGSNLAGVLDGSFLSGTPGTASILDGTTIGPALGPFAGNRFSQVVINPYPLESNDATLSAPERSHVGEHLCFVTNRVPIPIPAVASNPAGGDISSLDVKQVGQTARNSLGFNIGDYDIRFLNFENSIANVTDLSTKAAMLVNFLEQNFDQRTISSVITYVLGQIIPPGDRLDVSYKLSDVLSWGSSIRSLSVEAAFSVPDALAFVPDVFTLVASYAARNPTIYIAGYLSLRFVGEKTGALLGMQRWSPTCCVEYAMLGGSEGVDEFVNDLQKLALRDHGALHWGQCNEVMTSSDVRNIYGAANIAVFRRARSTLSQNGRLSTFDNSFTDRFGLGNGRTGIALTGVSGWASIPVAFSNGDGTWTVTNQPAPDFAAYAASPGVTVVTGDFSGNGRTDIALTGVSDWASIPVAFSSGDGTWTVTNQPAPEFAAWAASPGVKVVTGEFGNGRTGIALTGVSDWHMIAVASSNGDGTWNLTNPNASEFAAWAASPGVTVVTGDFSGNGRTDIALTGVSGWASIPVAFSNGDGTWTVTNQPAPDFAAYAASPGVTVVTGDFSGNGRTDIALTGVSGWASIPVAFSNGDGTWTVTNQPAPDFAAYAASPGVTVVTGDFSGNGRTGIALTGVSGWASIPVAFSNGDGTWTVTNQPAPDFAAYAASPGVKVVTGDFSGNGRTGIALTGVSGWASIPVAFSNGDGTWTVTNQPAPDFAAYAASPNAIAYPAKFT